MINLLGIQGLRRTVENPKATINSKEAADYFEIFHKYHPQDSILGSIGIWTGFDFAEEREKEKDYHDGLAESYECHPGNCLIKPIMTDGREKKKLVSAVSTTMDAILDETLQMVLNFFKFHDSLGRGFSYCYMGISETAAIETPENSGVGRGRESTG